MDFSIGQFMLTAFPFAPTGTLACNGQSLSISNSLDLFEILGTSYGGNGTTNFNIPDIPPVQAKNGPLNWVLVTDGAPYVSGTEALLAEVRLLPIAPPPVTRQIKSLALCLGQTLQPINWPALNSLLGTTYGGDGISSFLLPNLPVGNDTQGITYSLVTNGVCPARP